MGIFESFYSQEWVQVVTSFAFVVLLLLVPFLYWRISRYLEGDFRKKFVKYSLEVYGVLFFLIIAPVGYLVLYFFGGKSGYMLSDPLPWICLIGGLSAIYDIFRARQDLELPSDSTRCPNRYQIIFTLKRITIVAGILSLIPLTYGGVMVAVTNLVSEKEIPVFLWFVSFLLTGLAIIYAVASKVILIVAQEYSSNPALGCNES